MMRLVLVISVIICCLSTAFSIKCYQCISTDHKDPFQCNEFLEDYDITPTSCDSVYGAAYCIKQTGRFEGGLGTKRYCSSLDLGNYCNYIKQPGDELQYRSCVYTCEGDGCNSSNVIGISFLAIPFSLLLVYFS